MDWKSNLRRTQSLKSVHSSCDKPTWAQAGLRDKTTSVSQLVSRYQTTVVVSTAIQETSLNNVKVKPKQLLKEMTPSPLESKESHPEPPMRRNDERERVPAKSILTRSKSVGSLQNSTGSIDALKARFESKASMQNKAKSSFRAVSVSSPEKASNIMPVMNGGGQEVKISAEEPKTKSPAHAPLNDAQTGAKKDNVTRKVVNQSRIERRRTIGGIDFEQIAASQADEKRRSIADFRDNSFLQTKANPCVSVKAISALYLSKVTPQGSIKPAQDQSSESGKRVKLLKMEEDSKQRKVDRPPHPSAMHQPGPKRISGAHSQQSMLSQLSKEKFYQQRQKCELRRLLKHTHPELKLDDVVDEELAEVLSTEAGATAGETGYEGEVLSRCLIFENCDPSSKVSPYTQNMHMAEGTVERRNVGKTSAVFGGHEEKPYHKKVEGIIEDGKMIASSTDPDRECEEEMVRIDVQATRKIFESRSVNTSRLKQEKHHGKVSITGSETGGIQKQNQEFQMCKKVNRDSQNKSNAITKCLNLTAPPNKQGPCLHIIGQSSDHEFSGTENVSAGETVFEDEPTSFSDAEKTGEIIKTSAALLQNNPFVPTNIQREHFFENTSKSQSLVGDSGAVQDILITNVKNRAHLFESMPFDQIRHQNKDEIETMVENIKETLNFLYQVNTIHSSGSIIEVNETMIAKKAKFTLSEAGPKIEYNEVAEGGTQNFIVQLLPRTHLKPQITYLMEVRRGSMEATMVNVPVHQHHFTTNQDTEVKTANVVQLVEDILNQDNSLRKGVIIQEDIDGCADVIVYSLFNYFDEEDVKHYCPPQCAEYDDPEPDRGDVSKTGREQELRKGNIKSTISCLQETSKDQTCQGSMRPEITEKGNVKLFRSCIEKGDLEYLKTLQAEPVEQEQELPLNQHLDEENLEQHHEQKGDQAEECTEWVPVDVKRLKNMFSGDTRPTYPKQYVCERNLTQSTNISSRVKGQNVSLGKSVSSIEGNFGVSSHGQVKHTFRECGGQTEKEACNSTVAPQGSYLPLETHDDGTVHQAELVEVVDDNDEMSNLQTAIHSLQQATNEAKSLYQSSQQRQKFPIQKPPKEPITSITKGNVRNLRTELNLAQENEVQKDEPCPAPRWEEHPSDSTIALELKSGPQHESIGTCKIDTHSEEVKTMETTSQEEVEEVVFEGKLQAALDSLGRSNINVSRGDFKAAMIYRNSSKPHKESVRHVDEMSVQKQTDEAFCLETEPKSTQDPLRKEASKEQVTLVNPEHLGQSKSLNKPVTNVVSEKNRRPVGPKPAIQPKPDIQPKPEHLKVKQKNFQSTNTKKPEATQTNTVIPDESVPQPLLMTPMSHKGHKQHLLKINSAANSGPDSADLQRNKPFDEPIQMSQEIEVSHQVKGSGVLLEKENTDDNTIDRKQKKNAGTEEKISQDFPIKENMTETDESHVDFHGACNTFGGKKEFSAKKAPAKPKRGKISQPNNKNPKHMPGDNGMSTHAHLVEEPQHTLSSPSYNSPNTCVQTGESKDEKEMKQESKVEMRAKKGRTETEDERRQRLSVHMDEIMRGNIEAAMGIFDNLRKQEELQSFLGRVEEIEEDTSEVDVRSLRNVFENVPEWVVSTDKKQQRKVKVENKEERMPITRDNSQNKSSMAHVFGDLERASEEIINLKEQTLARLVDIEETIKKALYSVSTLKSDSDIVGLSCLFKESLGTVQGSTYSGNISKISIGSSRTKSLTTQESPAQGNAALPVKSGAIIEVASEKQKASPPSSPAFISIQSAARKTDKTDVLPAETANCLTCQQSPKTEEKFCTTKTLTCNSPAQNGKKATKRGGRKKKRSSNKRELSVLEVQTDVDGNSIVVTSQPETTTSIGQAVVSPATYQVTNYTEARLPINQKP